MVSPDDVKVEIEDEPRNGEEDHSEGQKSVESESEDD